MKRQWYYPAGQSVEFSVSFTQDRILYLVADDGTTTRRQVYAGLMLPIVGVKDMGEQWAIMLNTGDTIIASKDNAQLYARKPPTDEKANAHSEAYTANSINRREMLNATREGAGSYLYSTVDYGPKGETQVTPLLRIPIRLWRNEPNLPPK